MNRIKTTFQKAQRLGQGIFMAGMVPGFPDLNSSFKIAKAIIKAGADILELSASFSDPVADGPTLQQAHARVLKQRTTKSQTFQLYKKIRRFSPKTPLFVIEYANCVYRPGINNYYQKLATSGIDALLIPDLSLEEAVPFLKAAVKNKIAQVFIVAPTTPKKRLIKISQASKAFLYLVTITGVTGERKKFSQETIRFIQKTRQIAKLPVIAGFGISKPEHVRQALTAGVNGVVSCSAIINLINQNLTKEKIMMKKLKDYVQKMKEKTF